MICIGIDPSLTGFAISHSRDGKCLVTTLLEPTKNQGPLVIDRYSRCKDLVDDTISIILDIDDTLEPTPKAIICVEGYITNKSSSSYTSLIELGWQLRMMMIEALQPFLDAVIIEVPQTTLKKFVTGSGGAKKDLMLKEVFKRWDQDFSNDNEADAFALAQMARCIDNPELCQNNKQRDVISDLVKANHATLSTH